MQMFPNVIEHTISPLPYPQPHPKCCILYCSNTSTNAFKCISGIFLLNTSIHSTFKCFMFLLLYTHLSIKSTEFITFLEITFTFNFLSIYDYLKINQLMPNLTQHTTFHVKILYKSRTGCPKLTMSLLTYC